MLKNGEREIAKFMRQKEDGRQLANYFKTNSKHLFFKPMYFLIV